MAETGFEKYLERILDHVHEGIAIIDADGRYSFVNPAGERLLEKSSDQIIGRDHRDPFWGLELPEGGAVDPADMPATRVIETGEPMYGTEYAMRRSDNTRAMVAIDAEPFKDGSGRLVGTLISFSDITSLRQAERLSSALNDINAQIVTITDFDTVMQRTVDAAVEALRCDSGAILLRQDDDWVMSYVCNLSKSMIGMLIPEEQASFTTLTAGPIGAIAYNDAYNDERIDNEFMRENGFRSLLDVVIRIHGNLIGDISFHQHSRIVPFSQEDIDFANKLGASVGLALENTKLYNDEQHIIESLQGALLRVPASIEGIEFAHAYQAGGELGDVGGDFYDLFSCANNTVGIILGDVSGKGVEAAATAAEVKHTAKAYLFDGLSPSATAEKVNRILLGSTPPGIFATAVFATLQTETGQLTYCCAGHPPPLVKKPASFEWLHPSSTLLGAVPDAEYLDERTLITAGDALVLYTDGVTEARHNGEFYDQERLSRAISRSTVSTSSLLVDNVLEDVKTFTGGELSDDVAILAIHLTR